jgi:serine/threonine-protein kinase
LVPPDWRKQVTDPSRPEHRYVSPQGDATIAFSGRIAEQESPDEYLRLLAFAGGEDVTYLRRERDWLVAFGFKDVKHERKFYRKVMLSCDGHRWRHLNVEYLVTVRGTLERLIDDLSEVMDLTKNSGCGGDRPSSREIALSPEQQRCVYSSVPKFAKADLNMRLALGAEVPRDVKLFIFPGETLACDARLANFRFVVVEDQIVIVDPADYSVVDAISP